MDLIRIEGLELRCIVGLRSYERRREQPLRIDIALSLDLSTPGRSGRIGDTADYALVADTITALLRFREYRLLEVAAEECAALLFACEPHVQQVRLRFDKPEALAGRARSAAVEIQRTRGAFGATEEPTEFGTRVELLRTSEATIELVTVEAGRELRLADPHARLECIAGIWQRSSPPSTSRHPVLLPARQESVYSAGPTSLSVCRCLVHDPSDDPRATNGGGTV